MLESSHNPISNYVNTCTRQETATRIVFWSPLPRDRYHNGDVISPVPLRCISHGRPLQSDPAAQSLQCSAGCKYPIVVNVPRFVDSSQYAIGFGLQWNAYRRTQLDSFTETTISRDRLERCLGGHLGVVKDRTVLEAGCGAGRFTEVLLAAGAKVFACDLSTAVEANYVNCGGHENHFVCQADLEHLPVAEASFDVVVCLGVVQHTPDPERTIEVLCRQVKPGGLVALDHYAPAKSVPASRRFLRHWFLRLPPRTALFSTRLLVGSLWPLHEALWRASGRVPGAGRAYNLLRRLSPVLDYQRDLPELRRDSLREWAILDTHDTLTDVFKHVRTVEQIAATLKRCGMVDVEAAFGGNGVEARARRPANGDSSSGNDAQGRDR